MLVIASNTEIILEKLNLNWGNENFHWFSKPSFCQLKNSCWHLFWDAHKILRLYHYEFAWGQVGNIVISKDL